MSNKRQFLDPVATCCKLILLHFAPIGTKIRVIRHKIELTDNNIWETIVARRFQGDSRNDVCVLFPAIVRFIERYLYIPPIAIHGDSNIIENDSDSDVDDIEFHHDEKTDIIHHDTPTTPPLALSKSPVSSEINKDAVELAKMAKEGLIQLARTYEYDNAAIVLQYYANLLESGINGTYTPSLLPEHLMKLDNNAFLHSEPMKKMWTNHDIQCLHTTFKNWRTESSSGNTALSNSYKASIITILDEKDAVFLENITHSTSM
jgi:hypothetical protein